MSSSDFRQPARSPSRGSGLVAFLLMGCLAACGAGEGQDVDASASSGGRPSVAEPEAPEAELLDARPYASERFGALHGEVRVVGEVPARFPIGASSVADCTTHPDVEHLSDVVVVNDGRVQYAFVQLIAGYDPASVPPPLAEPAVMDQRGCVYTPHVLAMQKGRTLLVSNSDPATHNVNVKAPRNSASRNQSMVKGQAPLEFDLRRAEEVAMKCDIHPWMSAVVHVTEHPWFDVTDEAGAFRIPDVPPGDYVVEVKHERLGSVRGRVTVEAGRSTGFALTLEAE